MTTLDAFRAAIKRSTAGSRIIRSALLALTIVLVAACSLPASNFSQYPGFAEYYAARAPRATLPTPAEQSLLQRYRPRFFLPRAHAGMIDFYADYIAQGKLFDGNGRLVSAQVDAAMLNAHKQDPGATFVHLPNGKRNSTAVVYARIDRDHVDFGNGERSALTFLTYHAVFRHSGLPAGVNGWRAWALNLVADLDDWHQLDHYTAATIVLDQNQQPVALMLQQHNYVRSYVLGEEVHLPPDQRVAVDVAIRSNELFPHQPRPAARRAVRFLTPAAMRYLLGFAARPTLAADDLTHGESQADYRLQFLPPNDAFYTFAGFLGERRRLPGRDAPPGADYNVWPSWKPLGIALLAGYWRENDAGDLARFEATYAKSDDLLDFARAQAPVMAARLLSAHASMQ